MGCRRPRDLLCIDHRLPRQLHHVGLIWFAIAAKFKVGFRGYSFSPG
jgi:hypothetical protein